MKKLFALLLVVIMSFSLVACGSGDKVKNFNELDTSKFSAFLNGDGDCIIIYDGKIDDAVIDGTLADDNGVSITLTKENIFENGDGDSGLWFGDCEVKTGDTLNLTLSKEGFESLSFTVTVQ